MATAYQLSSEQQYKARGSTFYDTLDVTDDWNKSIFQHDSRDASREIIELDSTADEQDEEDN